MSPADADFTDAGFVADVDRAKLCEFADAIDALVDECRLHASDDGLHVMAVDAVNVGMVDATLDLTAAAADEQTVGIATERLATYLDAFQDLFVRDVSLAIDEADETLTVDHTAGSATMDCFDEASVRQDASRPGSVEYTATCRVSLSALREFADILPSGAEHVTIETCDDDDAALVLTAEAPSMGIRCEVPGTITDATGEPATGVYAADYLRPVFGALPNRMGTVRLGDGVPLLVRYDGELSVRYDFAPRITGGDDE